jgi:DHA1 family bicyclomycin/chloramphenicol resistance-like MFS transporter
VGIDEQSDTQHGTELDASGPVVAIIPIDEPEIGIREQRIDRALPFALALPAVTLTYWTIDILSPALPDIKDDLALSAAGTGLVFSLLFLGRLVANLPAAFLVDRIGAATTAAAGGVLLTCGSVAAALADGSTLLFPARVLQGIGISLLVTASLRSILRTKPGQGAAMTYFGFAATMGGVFGLQSGGYLTETFNWRAVFVLCVVLAAILTVTAFVARRSGAVVPAAAATRMQPDSNAAATRTVGSVLPALLFNFLVFVNYSIWVALPLYTERRFDASAEANANLLLVITVMHLVAAFPVGRAIRKWGGRPILIAGLLVAIAGTLLVLPAPEMHWLLVPLVLYGIGMVAAANAGSDLVLQRGGLSGRAVGMVRLSSDLGLVLGPFATGTLSDAFGYRTPFIALPIVTGIAVILALRDRAPGSGSARV